MHLTGRVFSRTLEMDVGITVLGPRVPVPASELKVAYVLHGITGDCESWANYSMLPMYALDGRTLYILPEAARSFYANQRHGFRYFDYITDELPEICRNLFAIPARRESTYIIGNSMGGFGALRAALWKPEQYAGCCAISSPCIYLQEQMRLFGLFGSKKKFVDQYGERLYEDLACVMGEKFKCAPDLDIVGLAQKAAKAPVKSALFLTCGASDPFVPDNRKFAESMKDSPLDLTYEEWPGEHNFVFFDQALKRAISRFEL